MLESPVNFFELVSAASFACTSVALLVSLCRRLHLTTRSPSFFSSFQADLSTAHSRCDEFFDLSASMSWYLMYVRFPLWHVFTTI